MKFTQMRLAGFKSFADPTTVNIDSGLTGVVGPNGCGKSNLVEALRWLMGENSAKNMRSGDMDEVIFSGTRKRPPRSHASVTLSLADMAPAPNMPFESADAEVSRRIDRGKGSDYRINSKLVRARDVRTLFADAATGAHSPAIVSQGKLNDLIHAKPEDRRRILEDAAAVSGLYTRRREAENKLAAAERNLTRLDDRLGQLEQDVVRLTRQAQQAARYKDLSRSIHQLEAWLTIADYDHLADEAAHAKTRMAVARKGFETAQAALFTAEREWQSGQEKLAEARLKRDQNRDLQQKLTLEKSEIRAQQAAADEQKTRLKLEHDVATQRLAEQQEAIADAEQALRVAQEKYVTLSTAQQDHDTILASRQQEQETAREAYQSAQETLRTAEAEMQKFEAEQASYQQQRQQIEAMQTRLGEQMARLKAEEEELVTRQKTLDHDKQAQNDMAQMQASVSEAKTTFDAVSEALAQAQAAYDTAQETARSKAHARHDIEADYARLGRDLDRLQQQAQALRSAQKWPSLVERFVTQAAPSSDQMTMVSAVLALGVMAGVDDTAPIWWHETNHDMPKDTVLAVAEQKLSSLLSQFDRNHVPSALRLPLAMAFIVENDTQASSMLGHLKAGHCLVSPDGAVWRWDGLRLAPKALDTILPDTAQRLASLQSQIRETESQINQAEKDLAAAKVCEAQSAQQAEQAKQVMTEATTKRHHAQNQMRAAEHAFQDAQRAAKQWQDDYDRLEGQIKHHQQQIASLAEEQKKVDAQWAQLATDRDQEAITARLGDLAKAVDVAQTSRHQAHETLMTAERSVAQTEAQQQAQLSQLAQVKETVAEAETKQATSVAKHQETAQRLADLQEKMAQDATLEDATSWADKLAGLEARLQEISSQQEPLQNAVTEVETHTTEKQKQVDSLRGEAQSQREHFIRSETQAQSADQSLGHLRQKLARHPSLMRAQATSHQQAQGEPEENGDAADEASRDEETRIEDSDVQKNPQDMLAALRQRFPFPDQARQEDSATNRRAWQNELDQAYAKRDRLGSVNLRAETEQAELKQELDTMTAERDDVLLAAQELRDAIALLNKDAREKLVVAFAQVNGHFTRLFTQLFGGGEARLSLSNAEDPLNAGLEIEACPPGKKLQNLRLLSGGEQTLTAVALIFAMFLTTPAPICVLDEVDAPLDDANVERLCHLLHYVSRQHKTRFMVITHNPITMAAMDRLYGVTMIERGVSKLVSVDLRAYLAEHMPEAMDKVEMVA